MANVLFNRLIKAGMAMTVPPLVVNQVLYTGEWICRITSTSVILPISRLTLRQHSSIASAARECEKNTKSKLVKSVGWE